MKQLPAFVLALCALGLTSEAQAGAAKTTYPVADASCSGVAIVRDALYIACERGTRLYRELISGDDLTDRQQYFVGTYGRLRTVEPAPDGGLWLTTTNYGDKDSIPNNSNEKIMHVTLGASVLPAGHVTAARGPAS